MRWPAAPVLIAAYALAAAGTAPAAPALASSPDWRNPVSGDLLRPFDRGSHAFAAGAHRGVDLAARPGQAVRTACRGRVAFAGVVAGRPVVTVACGSWRATHLPVVRPRVAEGERVGLGRVLGVVGVDDAHAGLHLGVRRAADSFGYVDPWRLLRHGAPADRPGPVPLQRRRPPRRIAPPPPRLVSEPVRVAEPAGDRRIAPLPVWIGLAGVLTGCLAGGGSTKLRNLRPRRTAATTAFNGHVRSRTRATAPPR